LRAEDLARAEKLFHRLAPMEFAARATALAEISSEDPALAAEIESLLAAHDTDGAAAGGPVPRLAVRVNIRNL